MVATIASDSVSTIIVVSLSLRNTATLRWLGETIRLSMTPGAVISSICLDACGSQTSMTFERTPPVRGIAVARGAGGEPRVVGGRAGAEVAEDRPVREQRRLECGAGGGVVRATVRLACEQQREREIVVLDLS